MNGLLAVATRPKVGRVVPRRTTAAPTITTVRVQESEETKRGSATPMVATYSKVLSNGEGASVETSRQKRAMRELFGILEQVVEQSSTSIPLPPKHPP